MAQVYFVKSIAARRLYPRKRHFAFSSAAAKSSAASLGKVAVNVV